MSPELLDPDLEDSHRTEASDCYALGMVIYEVLTGGPPFPPSYYDVAVLEVLTGERPRRPEGTEGVWFTEDLWELLVRCWAAEAQSRPSTKDVLECLERVSSTWKPPAPQVSTSAEKVGNESEEGKSGSLTKYEPS